MPLILYGTNKPKVNNMYTMMYTGIGSIRYLY